MSIVFHSAKIQKLLNHIETLFSCSIYVANADRKRMTCPRRSKTNFCLKVKEDPEYAKRCEMCDAELMKACEETGEPVWHNCHAGLCDGLIPIKKDGDVVGYLFYGQVRRKGSQCPEEFRRLGLIEEYEKLPAYTENELEALCYFLSQIDFAQCMRREEENGLLEEISTYIKEHLAEDLSAEKLCKRFHISKSQLYKTFSVGYSSGINQYVTKIRLYTARKLIRETNEPIPLITEKVGIGNNAYFVKMFKNMEGMTPNQYRKKTRNKE